MGRPTVTASSDHYFSCNVRQSIPLFKIWQNNFQVRIAIATGGTVGLVEWIIDGTHVSLIHLADPNTAGSDHCFHT